jgi:hypothetical protein
MKIGFTTLLLILLGRMVSAQVLYPADYREYGVDAGANLTTFPSNGVYNNTNKLGYVFGLWGRQNWGPYGLQTAVYLTDKNVGVKDNTFTYAVNRASFTSVDIPVLFNYKLNAFKWGTRIYTGPLFSFAFVERQNYPPTQNAYVDNDFVKLDYNTVNTAWMVGVGADVNRLTIDLRYEGGLDKIAYATYKYSHTRMSLVEVTFGYDIYPF